MGRVVQVSVSPGGVPKRAVESAEVSRTGLVGDVQRDKRHGGPERAVCVYSAELIGALRAEGHPISPGSVGENLTLEGVDWAAVRPGAKFVFGGGVELGVTSYTTPCSAIRGSFTEGAIMRIRHEDHPGWSRVYTRVFRTGTIRPGESVRLVGAEEGHVRPPVPHVPPAIPR